MSNLTPQEKQLLEKLLGKAPSRGEIVSKETNPLKRDSSNYNDAEKEYAKAMAADTAQKIRKIIADRSPNDDFKAMVLQELVPQPVYQNLDPYADDPVQPTNPGSNLFRP
jgi:hypothetical protein